MRLVTVSKVEYLALLLEQEYVWLVCSSLSKMMGSNTAATKVSNKLYTLSLSLLWLMFMLLLLGTLLLAGDAIHQVVVSNYRHLLLIT